MRPVGALSERNTADWLRWFSGETPPEDGPPKAYLAELPILLKKIRKDGCSGDQQPGSAIGLSDSELQHLIHLHSEVRNQLIHYEPISWSLDVSGLGVITPLIARIVTDILNFGWAFRHESEDWCSQLRVDLEELARVSSLLHQRMQSERE